MADVFRLPDLNMPQLEPPAASSKPSGPIDAAIAAFLKDTHMGQVYTQSEIANSDSSSFRPRDPKYSPFTDPELDIGSVSPMLFEELSYARDREEAITTLMMAKRNAELEQTMENHGLMRFIGNIADPYNFIPTPFIIGKGFKAAFRSSMPANLGIVAGSEAMRTQIDPTDSAGEVALNITMGTLLASGIGGAFGMIPQSPKAISARHHAYNAIQEHLNTHPTQANSPSIKDLSMDDDISFGETFGRWLPKGTKREDVIRGTADDGLGKVIRFQALRSEGQEFGDRLIIRADKHGDFTLHRNDQMVMRGSKPDLVKAADNLGTQRVDNFAAREALQYGRTTLKEVHPDMPDPKTDPEAFAKYVEAQSNPNAPRDADGAIIHGVNPFFNRHLIRNLMDSDRLDFTEIKQESDVKIARLEVERDVINQRLENPKSEHDVDVSLTRRDEIDNELADVKKKSLNAQKSLDEVNNRINLAEQSNNPSDYMIKSTWTGIEKMYARSGFMPFFAITETRLAKLAPDLAAPFQRIAYRLASSPGLQYNGGSRGVGIGTSAEMQSIQWWSHFRTAKAATDAAYAKLYGYGESLGPVQQDIMEFKESASKLLFRKDKDIDPSGKGLTFGEFRQFIGETLSNSGKMPEHLANNLDKKTIKAIEESSVAWRAFFDKFKDEAARLGVFQTEQSIGRSIDFAKNSLEEIEKKLNAIKHPLPFRDIDVDVRYQQITPEIKPPNAKGHIPGAFRRTENGSDVIYIDRERLLSDYEHEAWTNPMVEGVKPLTDLKNFKGFEEPDDYIHFVLAHEKAHVKHRIKKNETKGEYENRINQLALNEIYANLKKQTGSERMKTKYYQKEYDKKLLALDEMETQQNWMKGMAGEGDWLAPDYFFRIWIPDEIKKNEAVFKDMLRTHFNKNPWIWDRGKRVMPSTDPDAVEVRVNEAYNNVIKESEYDDPFAMKNPELRRRQVKARMDELKAELDALPPGPPTLESRTINRKIQLYQEVYNNPERMGSGLPSPLRSRALDIHNKEVLKAGNFMETDVEVVAHIYLQKMAPIIEVTRNFGDRSLNKYREPLNQALDLRVMELRAAGDEATAKAIEKEQVEINKAIDNLRDMVLGIYGMSKNPAHWSGRATRLATSYMNLVAMGRAVYVALNDVGNYVGYVGFKNALGDGWRYILARTRKDANEWNIGRDEVLWAGEANNIWSSTRGLSMTDIGGMPTIGKAERMMAKANQRMFMLNLLTPWTDFMEGMTGTMAQSAIIRDALAFADGKLSPSRMSEVTKLGMTREMAGKIALQWRRLDPEVRQGRHLLLANTDKWNDIDAVNAFRAMLATEIANLVPAPKAADKPTFMHKDWGRIMFQYKGFSFAATTRILMANMQRRDKRALNTVVSMIGMSYLIDLLKQPDFISQDFEEQLFRAVEISGVAGILSDANQMIEGASGGEAGMRSMLGLDPRERDVTTQTRFGAVAGAVPNLATSFGNAMLSDDSDTADVARAIRYAIPYNNVLYWSWLVSRIQRESVNLME